MRIIFIFANLAHSPKSTYKKRFWNLIKNLYPAKRLINWSSSKISTAKWYFLDMVNGELPINITLKL